MRIVAGKCYVDTIGAKVGPMKSPAVNVYIEFDIDGRSWDATGKGFGKATGFDLVSEWSSSPDQVA